LRNLSIRQQLMLPVTGNNAEFFLRPYGQQLGNTGFRQGFHIDRSPSDLPFTQPGKSDQVLDQWYRPDRFQAR
jgi:hypothetical protein